MSFLAFVKFALIGFDALAWPLFALGYPLRASIQAIEANSNSDTKKLVTYWIIFTLISLFEHAFMGILQWLQFWPHVKLTIVFWMMIPNFDGAFYVYNHFVHPFLYIDVQTIINWFKKQQELVLQDNFLTEAEKNVEAHGSEALEKLITSKGTEPSILQKDIKPVQVTEKREVALVNRILETEPNAAQKVNYKVMIPEVKGAVAAGCHSPEIPADKQVQKEWTCAMCQVTTTSENCLKSHLQGRWHRDTCEALTKAKDQPSKGKVSSASAVWVKNSELPREDHEPQKHDSSCNAQASPMKQQSSVAKNNDLPGNNTCTSNNAVNPKIMFGNFSYGGKENKEGLPSKSYLPEEEPKMSLPNNVAGNQLKAGDNVQGQKQFQKQNAKTIPQFQCPICNISCSCSKNLSSHLRGMKHLARLQELNNLKRGKVACY